MAHNPTITQDEMALLQWLGKEDFSQYGECHGTALDALVAKGFAAVAQAGAHQSGFIAKGESDMHRAVSVTELGRSQLKQDRETAHPAA